MNDEQAEAAMSAFFVQHQVPQHDSERDGSVYGMFALRHVVYAVAQQDRTVLDGAVRYTYRPWSGADRTEVIAWRTKAQYEHFNLVRTRGK